MPKTKSANGKDRHNRKNDSKLPSDSAFARNIAHPITSAKTPMFVPNINKIRETNAVSFLKILISLTPLSFLAAVHKEPHVGKRN